jgi:outer membrane protein assembly factor BamA
LGYHLDIVWAIDDRNLDLANGDTTFHWEYQNAIGLSQEKYTQSGFSLNALWDSRDNIVNPYSGSYAFASWRLMPEFLGSTSNATQLWLEYRNYFNLSKKRPRNLLAFWAYGWFVTSGTSSYMFLPAVGWDMFARSARPYTQGRFRGQDLLYSELEWRFPLQRTSDRWGGVVFLNATTASSRLDQVPLFDYVKLGYGAGLRFMIDKKKRVNLGLDYGRGFNGASGFFLNLNEYF